MATLDLKKELKTLYSPPAKPVLVDVPAMNFLVIDGQGDPNTSGAYPAALETLYAVAYGLKFMLKKAAIPADFVVMPSEGLWWVDNMALFSVEARSDWKWTITSMCGEFLLHDQRGPGCTRGLALFHSSYGSTSHSATPHSGHCSSMKSSHLSISACSAGSSASGSAEPA